MTETPLWMPSGSVRAILALTIISVFAGLCIVSNNIEALGLIAVMVSKDYFEMRKHENE